MPHGLGDGLAGATVAAPPSVALAGSHELVMMIIRAAADLLSNQRSARETQDLRHSAGVAGAGQARMFMQPGELITVATPTSDTSSWAHT